MKALLGTKIGMTQIISEKGVTIPITLIQAGPVTVTQVKTIEKDGYNAVQVAYGKGKNLSKAVAGHVKPAKITPKFVREIRVEDLPENILVGSTIDVSNFVVGDLVNVTGTSKGKGFAGTVKRHNFMTSRHTHGGKGISEKLDRLAPCILRKFLKVREWLEEWDTIESLLKT